MPRAKKRNNNDILLIIAAVYFLILSSIIIWFFGVKNHNNYNNYPVLPKIIGKADLTIDFGNGTKRIFEGNIIENETFVDILNQSALAGNFSYKLNGKSDLASIGELSNNDKKSWNWYLNGGKIDKQINKITVKSNDQILIKYE